MKKQPRFVMLVGLPAPRKSTVAEEYKKKGYTILSSDEIREELFGTRKHFEPGANEKVFNLLHKRIKEILAQGGDVVYDATNLSQKRRIHFLREIKRFNALTICHFMATPYGSLIERDMKRKHSVGKKVIDRMLRVTEVPQRYEGWDRIKCTWDNAYLSKMKADIPTLMEGLKGFNQNSPYHSLSLGDHLIKTYENLKEALKEKDYPKAEKEDLLMAALLHDIGKPFTHSYDEAKDRSVYYQHHLAGAYLSLFILYKQEFKEDSVSKFPEADNFFYLSNIFKIADLIQKHMYMYDIKQESTKNRFINLIGEEMYEKLELLHEADKAAH